MASSHLTFLGTLLAIGKRYQRGSLAVNESGSVKTPRYDAGMFVVTTGTSDVPDITFNQSANVPLIPDNVVPAKTRCYVTRLDLDLQGVTGWASASQGAAIVIEDSAGVPLAYFPLNCLRGESAYTFPSSDAAIPQLVGNGQTSTFSSYNSATGVLTFTGTPFIASALVNTPVTIYDGTGKGQTAIITANTNATLTVAPLFGTAPDATSVFAVWYWGVSAQTTGAATTGPTLQVQGTPLVVNSLDNGFNAIVVQSTAGQGQIRPIGANTTAGVLTAGFNWNTSTSSATLPTLIHITNETNLMGAIDLCVDAKWPTATLGLGIQAVLLGTFTAGSPVRIHVEGYFAA